uniref:Uncharacterized protein n=1 Tax=Anopheles atroparvus TaxID=41427 RepID=A0AAG5DBW7_ANOAO
ISFATARASSGITRSDFRAARTNGLRSPKSFLHPTRMTGVSGQNLRISGYHMARQFRSETGFAIEKQSSTTSELEKGKGTVR